MNYRIIGLFVLLTLGLSSGYFLDLSAQSNCDSSLIKMSTGPLGYRDRGDRCEGTYIKQVGSTTLFVASFTELFEQFDAKSGKPLQIEWDNLTTKTGVQIRALGVKQKLYYRMDSFRPAATTSYSWSTNILASLNILKKDIGVIGTTRHTIGQVQRDVYLPLRISQQTNAARGGMYNLVLLPGVELSEIYISIAPVGADGRPQKFIRDNEKLGYGYYPAERIIEIPISGLNTTGIYYMEIGAALRSGGISTLELWFYKTE
jgi:hypothetical protein